MHRKPLIKSYILKGLDEEGGYLHIKSCMFLCNVYAVINKITMKMDIISGQRSNPVLGCQVSQGQM